MTLTKIGASLSGGADVIHITHASHPFTVGQVLRSSGSAGVYTTAQADSAANAEVIGIVVQDIDTNTYAMALSGRITADGVVPVAAAGTVLFLSAGTPGLITTTEPTTTGQISKPIGVVTTSNLEMIMINYRGEVIATSTESWDVNGAELILDVDGDTSLQANSDDQIDVKISGADDFRFTANTLSILSGSTLAIDSGATLANSGTLTGFNSNSFTVTQASHGLAVGNVVKASGNSTFAKAQANTAANAEVVGVVTVVSGNDITITTSGEITVAAAVPNVAAGTVVFLHQSGSSDEGTLTATEPSTDDEISKPVAIVTHQNSKMVLLPFRGEILGTGAQSVADDSITLAKMAGGTDGNLITYDTSGNPAYVATGTATHVLTSNGADTVPTFQAAASAIAREGGNTTEATTTSTSVVDLLASSTLAIAAASPFTFFIGGRKTSGAAGEAGIGIKVNTTVTAEATIAGILRPWSSSATNRAESGGSAVSGMPRVTNYLDGLIGVACNNNNNHSGTSANLTVTAAMPNAVITVITIRAITESASNTLGSDELQVYSLAAS